MNYGKIIPVDFLIHFLPFPKDDVLLRRYMDLPKFLSMLTSQSLYFSSLGDLEDEFEGTYSDGYLKALIRQYLIDEFGHDNIEEVPKNRYSKITKHCQEFANRSKKYAGKNFFINCWTSNHDESYPLWKSYSDLMFGLCIQTTFGKIKNSYQDSKNLKCHHVGYLDHDQINTQDGNLLWIAFSKTKPYLSENEVRLFFEDSEDRREQIKGVCLKFDISKLIETVILAPKAPMWFEDAIIHVANTYGISSVKKSSIDLKK